MQIETNTYQELAGRVSATGTPLGRTNCIDRVRDHRTIRLIHAAMGLCTETGEIQDQLKRHIFYGAELDLVNVVEEIGDILWYVAEALNATDTQLLDVMIQNINKLTKRYPQGFTKECAINRDTESEREVLESLPVSRRDEKGFGSSGV